MNSIATNTKTTRFVILTACFAALGGLLFGYDTGVISGAVIFIKKDFGLSVFPQELVVSMVLVGAAIGALSGGRLADRFGRRMVLLATSAIFVVGAIVCAIAVSLNMLLVGRIIVGLGIGLASTTVPLYISESSPPQARGWQVSLFQLAVTVGILCGYLVDFAFSRSEAWRWMLGLAAIPGIMLGLGMCFLPESPRWLIKHGRIDAARGVLARIRGTHETSAELNEIQIAISSDRVKGQWSDLFALSVRPALIIGIGLSIFQQVTGINTVVYYAPTIIQSAGVSSASGAILATVGIGVVNVIMTILSMWLIDRLGRRPLLLIGLVGMIVTLGILGWTFNAPGRVGHSPQAAVITLMVYVASFAISLGPVFWVLIAEIYPLRIRGLAESTAATTNWLANLLVSLTFLSLVQALGRRRTFWLYGLLAIVAWFFVFYLVPETKGRTLEEIESSWTFTRRGEVT